MAFSKTLSQVLDLLTKKVTENTPPFYATLDIIQKLFAFVVENDDLLTSFFVCKSSRSEENIVTHIPVIYTYLVTRQKGRC